MDNPRAPGLRELTQQEIFEVRKQFRDETEFVLAPIRDQIKTHYHASLGYAEQAIKASFTLNGGALVAIPTFAALLRVNASIAQTWLVIALGCFTIGLLATWATTILGYFSTNAAENSWNHSYNANRMVYTRAWNQSRNPPLQAEIDIEEAARKSEGDRADRLQDFAIYFGLASIPFFLGGTFISFYVFIHYAGTAADLAKSAAGN